MKAMFTAVLTVGWAVAIIAPAAANGLAKGAAAPPAAYGSGCGIGPFSGAYLGANAGWARADAHQIALNNGAELESKDQGWTVGGHIGYNLQCGRILLGAEADINWIDLKPSGSNAFQTLTTSYDYFGTLRGRLGIVHDNVLFFVTAGAAYADVNHKLDFPLFAFSQSNSDVKWGWTIGGGIEFSRGHWSVRGEVLYVDLNSSTHDYTLTTACGGGCTARVRWEDEFLVARLGVSIKLHRDEPRYEPLK